MKGIRFCVRTDGPSQKEGLTGRQIRLFQTDSGGGGFSGRPKITLYKETWGNFEFWGGNPPETKERVPYPKIPRKKRLRRANILGADRRINGNDMEEGG